jgi:hypothetical protein
MVDGYTKDVMIDPLGNVLEVEEQVQQGAIPAMPSAVFVHRLGKAASGRLNPK